MSANSLPSQPTSFVGREQELADIARLLADPACRLVALVGPGGMGKTRLAIEAAQQLDLPDGVYFVPFQSLAAPEFMVSAIAEAIGFQFSPGGELKQQLFNFLRAKSMLLMMDNLEHLLDGVSLLAEIIAHAPGVRLLATSRERLNLREEWVLDVGGLPFPLSPDEADIERYSAVALFLQHTRRVKVSLHLNGIHKSAIVRICRAVGGMPLGLELASNWVRVLPLDEIASEVERCLDILETPARNTEPRHRNMRAAFEPTWNRLTEDERHVFIRLSVFRGGFTHQAAQQVAGASLHVLSSLGDKSLVRIDANGRYDLHELLRQYGEERLNVSQDEAVQTQDSHCRYYSTFLEQCGPRFSGRQIKQVFQEIETEQDNIRAAWNWAVRQQKAIEIERSLDSLWFFYDERGRYQEGEQTFASAAAAFSGNAPQAITMRAKIQVRQGAVCHDLDLFDKGSSLLRDSIEILRHSGDRVDLALALRGLSVLLSSNDVARSEVVEFLEESLAIFSELNDRWNMAHVLSRLSYFYSRGFAWRGVQGALEPAEECAWQCLTLYQQLESPWGIAAAYLNLAEVACLRSEYEKCQQYTQKSLSFFREFRNFWGTSESIFWMSEAACRQGAYAKARWCAAQGLQIFYQFRLPIINYYSLFYLALAIQILLGVGEMEKAHQLMGLLHQQRQKAAFRQKHHPAFGLFAQLEADLPPHLTAAFQRGQEWDADTAIQEIIADFSRSGESEAALTAPPALPDALTARELEILRLLAAGLSNPAIAQKLIISVGTVKAHTSSIYSKLGVDNRVQAINEAKKRGLL